ncbi:DUF3131 domain-containing protein [Ferrimonas aestuarii]|uniref:DUF3131 domain-containing protein n=1 Tax=Ferrimonas aestuarii TaxID=2569539 RepID=A0A4U1BKV1_9GAMM|nr:DUF3131 domain-containing protein [Ferrimonas aestuarii]TKB53008.1 DUF3131 domain-containing protein [Ferrimonas aestuarii]
MRRIVLGTLLLTACAQPLEPVQEAELVATEPGDGIGVDRPKPTPPEVAVPQPRRGPLTEREMAMARVAWKYFENNYQPSTGLVNAVDGYPSTTLWDTASYLGGMVVARELGIVGKREFDDRMVRMIKTLNTLDLYRGEVPNKAYNTMTAAKVDYGNNPGEIGYSALDLGRFLIWMWIIKERYPEHAPGIDAAILRWNFCHMIDDHGMMFGAMGSDGEPTQYLQEGRLGYEEYAAKGFQLWGFHTERASKPEPYEFMNIYGIDIPYDSRDPRELSAHSYVVTESYALDGIEFAWDHPWDTQTEREDFSHLWMADFAQRVYAVQEARYLDTGIITARTEHQLDQPPYFVYDTVYTDGYSWNTISEKGEYMPQFAAVSIKGAIGLWVLWDTPYTDILFEHIADLYNPEKGFYEGIYENGTGLINTYTSNNNGILLEALGYKAFGKLAEPHPWNPPSRWDSVLGDEFSPHIRQCLPSRHSCSTCRPCTNCG